MTGTLRWLGIDGAFTVHPYDAAAYPTLDTTDEERVYKRASIVDVETLGLASDAPVIEIAIRQVAYDPVSAELLGLTGEYSALNDPGTPIPPDIAKLTGITDDDVRGQKIDPKRVATLLACSSIVIAHNAGFDRPRVDALAPTAVPWACSCTMIDWKGHGLPSASLGALCLAHGFYVADSHRAMGDVAALLHLLEQRNAETGRTYLQELLAEARKPVVLIFARGAPFERKDALKARGYQWVPEMRVWSHEVHAEDAAAERAWLAEHADCSRPEVVPVNPRSRFAKGMA